MSGDAQPILLPLLNESSPCSNRKSDAGVRLESVNTITDSFKNLNTLTGPEKAVVEGKSTKSPILKAYPEGVKPKRSRFNEGKEEQSLFVMLLD